MLTCKTIKQCPKKLECLVQVITTALEEKSLEPLSWGQQTTFHHTDICDYGNENICIATAKSTV